MTINQIAGILPAVIFPAATLAQLAQIVRRRSAEGVSVSTWLLFGFANLGIYVYAERYTEWQAIVGMLLTAVIDFAIVALVLAGFGRRPARSIAPEPRAAHRRQSPPGALPDPLAVLPPPARPAA